MLCSIRLIQEKVKTPNLASNVKKSENPEEGPSTCTEVHYCYNSIEPVPTYKEILNCQIPALPLSMLLKG